MFNDKQLQVLSYDLDASRIKSRDKAGISFKYIETYDAINVANNIFNYDWEYHIKQLTQVGAEINNNGNHVITYSAIVTVRIWDVQHKNYIEREDTGVGIGTAKMLGDAIDVSSKSSVSDSLKRALRSLGSQFGNNLYSKTPIPVQQPQQQIPSQQHQQPTQQQSNPVQDYSSLYNIGLQILEQGNDLVVMGPDIFNKKDSIKACGFRWDGTRKLWFKSLLSQEAA